MNIYIHKPLFGAAGRVKQSLRDAVAVKQSLRDAVAVKQSLRDAVAVKQSLRDAVAAAVQHPFQQRIRNESTSSFSRRSGTERSEAKNDDEPDRCMC